MKKILLIIALFATFFLTPLSVEAQSGFRSGYYYTEQYQISSKRVDYKTYWNYDSWGNRRFYERWKRVRWHQRTGTYTYYAWQCNQWGQYQWYTRTEWGTYWYYDWYYYNRYYHYWNGMKIYEN